MCLTRSRRRERRRGAALAVVLVALVVVAGLAAGATLASRQTRRAARDEMAQLRASAAAEGALVRALYPWDRRRNQLAPGASDSVARSVVSGADVALSAIRLDADRILVEAVARARATQAGPGAFAERGASVVVRLRRPTPDALGAITVAGAIDLANGSAVDGRDAVPNGWLDCPAVVGSDSVAIAVPSLAAAQVAPAADVRGVVVPSVRAAAASTYDLFGAERWAELARRADVTIDGAAGPVTPSPRADSVGACVVDASAWSEPRRGAGSVSACTTTYALIHAAGGLTVRGPARGQGVLLVDGHLTIENDLTFAGVVVVRGVVRVAGGALQLHGALLVAGGGRTALGAGTSVHFSRCALGRALDGTALAAPVRRRAWSEVTG